MSNDIIQELEADLSREKEKIFFKTYKYPIIAIIISILLGTCAYQYYRTTQESNFQKAAFDYYQFRQFYNNIDNLKDINSKEKTLLQDTIDNVPNYFAMSQLIKFNNAQKNDASEEILLQITDEYIKKSSSDFLSVHDSLLKLFNLSLKTSQTGFKKLEPQFINYLTHPFAFKAIAYEILFLLSLKTNDADKAFFYLQELQKNIDTQSINKIKIYQTHPLIQKKINQEKSKVLQSPKLVKNNH